MDYRVWNTGCHIDRQIPTTNNNVYDQFSLKSYRNAHAEMNVVGAMVALTNIK